jgi:uncharacterized protein YkwD
MRQVPLRHAALGVALAVGLVTPVGLSAPAPAVAWDVGAFEPASEIELVGLTNRTRVAAGLPPLEIDPRLGTLARWRSRDMVDRAFFSHDLPDGGTVFDVLSRRRYCFRLAGENIGWNTWSDPEATRGIHGMFLESPGHRRNVVGTAWDAIGVGAYKGPDGRKVWTVLFADACERSPVELGPGAGADVPTAAPEPLPSRERGGETAAGSALGRAQSSAPDPFAALGWLGATVLSIVERLVAAGTGVAASR